MVTADTAVETGDCKVEKDCPKVGRWLCRNGKRYKESMRSTNLDTLRTLEAIGGAANIHYGINICECQTVVVEGARMWKKEIG